MKRNLLDYKQVMDALERERKTLLNREQYEAEDVLIEHAINVIAELPVIRQPEIIRCRDCKYFDADYYCKKHVEHVSNIDYYCADGERR